MSQNDDWYLQGRSKPSLRSWIFSQMAMGAVYAALVLFGIIAVLLIIFAVSKLLPDDPYAVLDVGASTLRALV